MARHRKLIPGVPKPLRSAPGPRTGARRRRLVVQPLSPLVRKTAGSAYEGCAGGVVDYLSLAAQACSVGVRSHSYWHSPSSPIAATAMRAFFRPLPIFPPSPASNAVNPDRQGAPGEESRRRQRHEGRADSRLMLEVYPMAFRRRCARPAEAGGGRVEFTWPASCRADQEARYAIACSAAASEQGATNRLVERAKSAA